MKYKAGNSYVVRIRNKDANIIGDFIEQNSTRGRITPKKLVELAKPKRSPIHKYFTWDNKECGEKYRLYEATHIIKAIVIVIEDEPVKAFHSIIKGQSREYISLEEAQRAPNVMNEIIECALMEAQRWADRYRTYKKLTPIVRAISTTKRRIANGKGKNKQKGRK
mgnify:CR=1 FL=1